MGKDERTKWHMKQMNSIKDKRHVIDEMIRDSPDDCIEIQYEHTEAAITNLKNFLERNGAYVTPLGSEKAVGEAVSSMSNDGYQQV